MTTSSPPSQPPPPQQHWCHHCDKRVSVEPSPDNQSDVMCSDCKFGFVEPIPLPPPPTVNHRLHDVDDDDDDGGVIDDNTLGSQFVHVLRLLAQVARDDNPSPPSPPPRGGNFSLSDDPDFLRIEINNEEEEEEEGENEDEDENENDEDEEEEEESVRSVDIEGDEDSDDDNNETEDDVRRRQRREMLHRRLRDFTTRARSGRRNRILEWAEILMGLENNSIEFRFEEDRYIGNPGDYVNEAEYEALLQNLADSDGRRGAPPASKTAVDALKVVEVKDKEACFVCAICKDGVSIGEVVKEMPCGHCYHGDCIVPWLAARNSCPVCRFELPTDDPEYEEDKRKKVSNVGGDGNGVGGGASGGGSSSLPTVDDEDEDGLF